MKPVWRLAGYNDALQMAEQMGLSGSSGDSQVLSKLKGNFGGRLI